MNPLSFMEQVVVGRKADGSWVMVIDQKVAEILFVVGLVLVLAFFVYLKWGRR